MDLKQKYREETNLETYVDIEQKDNYTIHYVKWLEKQLLLVNVTKQREFLTDFCLKAEQNAGEYKFLIPNPEFIDKYLESINVD